MKLEFKSHQREAFEFAKDRTFFANFDDMGLGKSLVELARIHYLWKTLQITGAVWITPKSITHDVLRHIELGWPDEDPKPDVLIWRKSDSLAYAKAFNSLLGDGSRLRLFICNVEGFSSPTLEPYIKKFTQAHLGKNFVVVDEASRIKERSSLRTKRVLKLFSGYRFRDIMTGSPVLNTPTDLWAPCRLLSPMALGVGIGGNFYSFRARYSVLKTDLIWAKGPLGPEQRPIKIVAGYRNLDELAQRLTTFSVRRTAEEVLDLPDRRYEVRHVELTQEQEKLMKTLKKDLRVLINETTVKVTNVLGLMAKMHQVVLGFLKDADGTQHRVPSHRLRELGNVLEEVRGKVIIWASHHASIEMISDHLAAEYGPESFVTYYGETANGDRAENLDKFRDLSVCRFLVANPTVGGIGLTLTEACTCVYWNNTFRLEDRLQSERRVWRIGQERPVLYVDLLSPKTIDDVIFQALESKVDISKMTMGDIDRLKQLVEDV